VVVNLLVYSGQMTMLLFAVDSEEWDDDDEVCMFTNH